jgi:hypothetical protein
MDDHDRWREAKGASLRSCETGASVRSALKLIQIKAIKYRHRNSTGMTDLIVFRCPHTGMNVQTHLERQTDRHGRRVEAFSCPACTRLHFIDLVTGRPVSRER